MVPAGLLFAISVSAGTPTDSAAFERILLGLQTEACQATAAFRREHAEITAKLAAVNQKLATGMGRVRHQKAMLEKMQLLESLSLLEAQSDVTLLKIRYRKGVDLIRVMYEKILGLDHHFTGLHTYQNIGMLSNPHSYPEFEKAKESLEKSKNRRYSMKLPALLESNPIVAGTFTLVSLLLGESSQEVKEEEAGKIACILDFTVRMNAELTTIRNETEFLKNANQSLKVDCQRLFTDYARAAGYQVPLEDCRKADDWETLFSSLDEKMEAIEGGLVGDGGPVIALSRDLVNIEFATQRVADFIIKYSDFIGQGMQYYRKFDSIVNNYQNEEACQAQLPHSFDDLKKDISLTIEKFQNTYNLPEIQGSRLKDLMYGVGE